MPVGLEISPIRPGEHEAAFQLRVRTFTSDQSATFDPDAAYIPDDRRLIARLDGRIVGQFGIWPFAQVYGGREVPMGGVGGVTIAADQRGQGVASRLMAAGLEMMRDHGDVISTLYPATIAPYRAWGWALAGSHMYRTVPTRALTTLAAAPADIVIRPATEDDMTPCMALAQQVARTEPGGLVGPEVWYRRSFRPGLPEEDGDGLDVAVRDGEVVGFTVWGRHTGDVHGWQVDVDHLIGTDAEVERAMWRQLGTWWSVAPTTRLVSWPSDQLLVDLPERDTMIEAEETWMTRLVDAAGAVRARGFPPGLEVSVPLRIHDRRVPANDGPFVLTVSDGRGALEPGGPGRVEVDVGHLAALYTGFTPASVLARRGGLPGATADDVAQLGWAFGSPTPWMREYF